MFKRICLFLALAMFSSAAAGCQSMWPSWFRPGTVEQQRYRASVHDPYPDVDAGPEVVGGRPREFQQPLAEPVRGRVLHDNWWQGYTPR